MLRSIEGRKNGGGTTKDVLRFLKKQIENDILFCPYYGKFAPQGDALAEPAAAARMGD